MSSPVAPASPDVPSPHHSHFRSIKYGAVIGVAASVPFSLVTAMTGSIAAPVVLAGAIALAVRWNNRDVPVKPADRPYTRTFLATTALVAGALTAEFGRAHGVFSEGPQKTTRHDVPVIISGADMTCATAVEETAQGRTRVTLYDCTPR